MINYKNIISNVKLLEKTYQKKIIFVVKNNGYNCNLNLLIKNCLNNNINHFATTSLVEALVIRNIHEKAYIIILNPLNKEELIIAIKNRFIISITSYNYYIENKALVTNAISHLSINVGMNRFGINNIEEINEIISQCNVKGIYTHFPVSECNNLELHNNQVTKFVSIIDTIDTSNIEYLHSENSATLLLRDSRLQICNYARIGLLCYGYWSKKINGILPSIFIDTKIIQLNKLKKGELISYGLDNIITYDCTVGICPIGYGDGLSLSRQLLPVYINNKPYQIISISMSHIYIIVDTTINLYDSVEIYGNNIQIDDLVKLDLTSCSLHMSYLRHH